MSILIADRTINSIYISRHPTARTLFVVFLIKQWEDLDVSLTEMFVVILQTTHAIIYRRKGNECFSAWSLKVILSNHDCIISFSIARNGKRFEELGDVFFGCLEDKSIESE